MASIIEATNLDVPVERAYEVWSDIKQWPSFMSHIDRVETLGDNRFKWWLSVAGAEREFVAELTEVIANDRIAWKTLDGVDHAGVATFHRLTDATSRITLQIDYEPEGFLEHLGAITNLTHVLANYDLGEFKAVAEHQQ